MFLLFYYKSLYKSESVIFETISASSTYIKKLKTRRHKIKKKVDNQSIT